MLEQLQILAHELEDLAKEFQVDMSKIPLTEDEISERIGQMIEATFGRDMFEKVKDARQAVA